MVYTNRKGMSDEELKAHERQLSSKSSSKHYHCVIKPSTEKMEKRRIQNAASHQRREERFNKTIETLASVGKDNEETILKGGNSTKKQLLILPQLLVFRKNKKMEKSLILSLLHN